MRSGTSPDRFGLGGPPETLGDPTWLWGVDDDLRAEVLDVFRDLGRGDPGRDGASRAGVVISAPHR